MLASGMPEISATTGNAAASAMDTQFGMVIVATSEQAANTKERREHGKRQHLNHVRNVPAASCQNPKGARQRKNAAPKGGVWRVRGIKGAAPPEGGMAFRLTSARRKRP